MSTLESVLIDLTMRGVDRGALVYPTQPGVLVLMTSNAAIRSLGPPLIEFLKTLGDTPTKESVGDLTPRSALKDFFTATERAPFNYAWFDMQYFSLRVLGVCVVGQERSERVAAICNGLGVPCSLDSEQAAPGWKISKRIER